MNEKKRKKLSNVIYKSSKKNWSEIYVYYIKYDFLLIRNSRRNSRDDFTFLLMRQRYISQIYIPIHFCSFFFRFFSEPHLENTFKKHQGVYVTKKKNEIWILPPSLRFFKTCENRKKKQQQNEDTTPSLAVRCARRQRRMKSHSALLLIYCVFEKMCQ